ncbi:pyridoxal phosphate-dependent transferase [Clohesyomyces aquaticus]|uniref:Pyridoxal phosphate-dependent transferase n=1 Tax=Clohesyomyces aquaticus TaxID=1231657 RepID=A0A1Y1ZUC5_9PLEO|nr:pyridoxal phosphate-dependent transferase [Clohesyomyces aquaticus]
MVMVAFSDIAGSGNKKLINLLRGWPNTTLLPTHLLERASHNALTNKAIAFPAMLYGPDPGDPRLRKNVAAWLTSFYQGPSPISPERITITGGASQNLACLLQVFTDPVYTRNVWMVSPSYMLAFRIFDDSGFHKKLRAVPEDDEGIDIEFLRKEIKKSEDKAIADGNDAPLLKPFRPWGKIYRHIIYAVPTFSNPSFKTMTMTRREELVRLAREYDALIITDDVYDFLQWPSSLTAQTLSLEKAVLPRIVDVDRFLDGGPERTGADGFGNAASNGSFSKIFGPGLRTGWVEGTEKLAFGASQTYGEKFIFSSCETWLLPPPLGRPLPYNVELAYAPNRGWYHLTSLHRGSSRSGGAPSQLTATFVAETLESGELQRYVFETLQPAYAERYRKMVSAINKYLIPLGVRLPQTDRDVVGGYFIWLTLPKPLKGFVVAQRAKDDENLIVAQGEIFEVPGDTEFAHFERDLRICFAWEDIELLGEGVERLARVIRSLQNDQSENNRSVQHGTGGQEGAKDFW